MNFADLRLSVSQYIKNESDLKKIEDTYFFAEEKHHDQKRKSGEEYITHPLEVAGILSELRVGPNTIMASLLHDVVEDTSTTLIEIKERFGSDVAELVDGLTKVEKLTFTSLHNKQAQNHQKMLLAMARDIRVIVIKLADRLHNMRTLSVMNEEQQQRISKETLEIYAPIAHKLGIFKWKAELEDRALWFIDPHMCYVINNLVKTKQKEREVSIDKMIDIIKTYITETDIICYDIKGRTKNVYSIYKKMVKQNKAFEDIYDIQAIRIIIDRVETCYQILGIVHAHFTPIPKRFKDYIAVPKPNMYQSLHTTVIGTDDSVFEIQIRTKEMDTVAEYGIAAHWGYKENVVYSREKEQFEIAQRLKWYADLLKITDDEEEANSEDYVETIITDILDANVYVYTPKGEVIALTKGSTPIDFAYKIHTDIGHKTVGAIVNNKIVPLSYELQTGDIITMRTNKNSFGPSEDWLKIVKTNHAKHKIKNFLNKQNRDLLIASGKAEVEKELKVYGDNVQQLSDAFAKQHFSKNNVNSLEDLLVEVGKGIISPKTVAQKASGITIDHQSIIQKQIEKANRILVTHSETGVVVEGISNPQLKLANCCYPIPGDEIVGFVTKGNGIAVHRKMCNNLQTLDQVRTLKLDWASSISRKYPVFIKVSANQSTHIISDVINAINALSLQIASVNAINTKQLATVIKLKVLVNNRLDLENLIVNLRKVEHVHSIERITI